MIVVVDEQQDDGGNDGNVIIIDTTVLDLNDKLQQKYHDLLVLARPFDPDNDETYNSFCSYEASFSFGEWNNEAALVNPPCHVDKQITLWITNE